MAIMKISKISVPSPPGIVAKRFARGLNPGVPAKPFEKLFNW